MGAEIAANAPLDYVKFQILQQNRFNAFIYSDTNEEMAGQGFLDQLLYHLPNIKDQLAKEPCDNFKLELPDNVGKRAWFTKATFSRFLHTVGSPDLEKCVAITNESCQLEETRKFHLSIYAKAEGGIASSNNSKSELLFAMDSRIAALMEKLVSTFNSAIGETFSSQEMMDLQEFCQHFGDVDIRNLLSKLSEASQKDEHTNKAGGNNQITGSRSDKAVNYESEDLSFSSEDEPPSVERSRSFRRSSSPMRRIQVGRSGPHRTPALTIKNLTGFPTCKPEASKEPDKKTEINVRRISVQDAISLFESKQRDQKVDTQNSKSFGDNSIGPKKSVLRRWGSGSVVEHITSEDKPEFVYTDALKSEELNTDSGMSVKTVNLNEDNVSASEVEKTSEKLDLQDCNGQKEEELSQIVMFAETNKMNHSSKNRNSQLDCNNRAHVYKDTKEEMRKVDNAGKRVHKPAEFRPKQKIQKPKVEKSFVTDGGKKQTTNRAQNDKRSSLASSNSKEESQNPNEAKKVYSKKSSALPTTRKSWPSTPSPRTVPGKTSAPRQKPQSLGPISRPNPKVEISEVKKKEVKKPEFDTKKSSKKVEEGKSRVMSMKMNTLMVETKSGKTSKIRAVVPPREGERVAKKSTIVPLEAKPSPRKVWEIIPVSIPAMVEETSNKCEEPTNIQEREIDTEKLKPDSAKEVSDEIPPVGDEIDEKMRDFSEEIHPVEEPVISQASWEEKHDAVSSLEPRVRNSLSHMLLQESCKPDIIECGNVGISSTIVYQKDAPKGLKRLLKFARKNNKGETNGVGLTSPYTSSEEEDEDECRTLGKRNSDNLTRKASLHSKNFEEQCSTISSAQSSNKFQEGHGSSKGKRPFFSLSAFRGNKS